eukprot:scaffold2514_cov205-Pinguiococcus_pyrenoidosus.AAC.2
MPPALNPAQRSAASADIHSPLLILAGAGTGKTSTLLARIRFLLESRNVEARNVLTISFTRSAAKELRDRLRRDIPTAKDLCVNTFHSLALKICRAFVDRLPVEEGGGLT